MSGNICSDLNQYHCSCYTPPRRYGSVQLMNDADLDNAQHHLLRCSDAEPNCGTDGVQGHWIMDTSNPQTYLKL